MVNNGKQTGVNNGNSGTSVKWAAPGSAGHKADGFAINWTRFELEIHRPASKMKEAFLRGKCFQAAQ